MQLHRGRATCNFSPIQLTGKSDTDSTDHGSGISRRTNSFSVLHDATTFIYAADRSPHSFPAISQIADKDWRATDVVCTAGVKKAAMERPSKRKAMLHAKPD